MLNLFGFQVKSISYALIFISLLSSALFILYMHYGFSSKSYIQNSNVMLNNSIKKEKMYYIFSNSTFKNTATEINEFRIINNYTKNNSKRLERLKTPAFINVLIIFSNLKNNGLLKGKLTTCLSSLFSLTSTPLKLHILGDSGSQLIAEKIVQREIYKNNAKVEYTWHDVDELTAHLNPTLEAMRQVFSKPGAYYSHTLFYLSTILHRLLSVHRIIALDIDIKFQEDILLLYRYFQYFHPKQLIGIAYEQQPVYRHTFYMYRNSHPNTHVGNPPPNGLPGFNSGVLLLDLQKMRNSRLYNSFLNSTVIKTLANKYSKRRFNFFHFTKKNEGELFLTTKNGYKSDAYINQFYIELQK